MRIAVSSQNFRTITGHAGKARRFFLYDAQPGEPVKDRGRLDMDKAMALHNFSGTDHPLFDVDVVVTGGSGDGFIRKLAQHGVKVITTSASDPSDSAQAVVDQRTLPEAVPHQH